MLDLASDDLAWCETAGRLVFLDLAQDRYFMLADNSDRQLRDRLASEGRARWHQPDAWPRPADWSVPRHSSPAIGTGTFRLAEVAAAMWTQRRIERRLAARSFRDILTEFGVLRDRRTRSAARRSSGEAVIAAFEQARLLRTAADRCLARSLALALRLAARGETAHVVLGVRLAPFGAHCWAQQGDVVLSDSVEEVTRYTPILVV